ncbi:MAG: hypothetical protein FWH57_12030, partial [Oscillospiraceae bacterium]|nr:hypothetical protein [Oscillospiraceae bacterium]
RYFSRDNRVNEWWANIFPAQGKPSKDDAILGRDARISPGGPDPDSDDRVMLIRQRNSRIYYRNALFEYPVTLSWNTLRNMGLVSTLRACTSYLLALVRKLPEDNLENFYINRFGKSLYSMFFEGYTEKVWGRHPREITADWGTQRVRGLSILSVLKDVVTKLFRIKSKKVETSLIESFNYPKLGAGHLWTAVAEDIRKMGGVILTEKRVIQVERDECGNVHKVGVGNGDSNCDDDAGNIEEFNCDILISSMPIKDLISAMDDVPSDIRLVSDCLEYRDFQTVGVLLPIEKLLLRNTAKRPTIGGIAPDCWIYVQDMSVKLGRIQVFNNWSPYLVKDFETMVWLGLEYFCNEGDEYWMMSDDEFAAFAVGELLKIGFIASADDIISTRRERVRKAYPAYFGAYSDFGVVQRFLDGVPNLFCIGRNGQHRYNNMDHSMLTAFAAADSIRSGSFDKTAVWSVNTEDEYHEAGA